MIRLTQMDMIYHFDINGIERVEILKGPYSSLYGADAMSGVINIVSKKGYNNPKKVFKLKKDLTTLINLE